MDGLWVSIEPASGVVGGQFDVVVTVESGTDIPIEVALTPEFSPGVFTMDDKAVFRDVAPGESIKAVLRGTCNDEGASSIFVRGRATIAPESGPSYDKAYLSRSELVTCTLDTDDGGDSTDSGSTDGGDASDSDSTDGGGSTGDEPSGCDGTGDMCRADDEGDCTGGTFFTGTADGCVGSEHMDIVEVNVHCPDPTLRLELTLGGDLPSPAEPYDEFGFQIRSQSVEGGYSNFVARAAAGEWELAVNGQTVNPDTTVTTEGNRMTLEIGETTLAELGPILGFDFSSYSWSPEAGQGPSDEVEYFDSTCR